jgi:hypothetical protein
METTSLPSQEPTLPNPGPHAELVFTFGPAQRWGSAKGLVPADQAHHLVTTFGILGCLVTGIGGAVLTVRTASGWTDLAYAELTLALVAVVLTAVCSRTRTGKARRHKTPPARVGSAGKKAP